MARNQRPGSEPPAARVCLLGASNLTRGFRSAVRVARGNLGGPLEIFAALGRGRSYGTPSSFLGRELPGIGECGLWPALGRAGAERALPTFGLISDVGNDVAFGVPSPLLLEWIARGADRLAESEAHTTLVGPPLESVRGVSLGAFRFWSRLFFPGRGLDREHLLGTLEEVDGGLRELCAARGLVFVEPAADWYGVDPIHVRHGAQERAWRAILASWGQPETPPWSGRVPLPAPLERRLLGLTLRRDQPAARLTDGSPLSIY